MATLSIPSPRRLPLLSSLFAIFLAGGALFLLVLIVVSGAYQVWYSGRILPGVSVAGVDLSGLDPDHASLKLSQNLIFPNSGRILFRDGEKNWLASPTELGLVIDTGASIKNAFQVGRSGSPVNRLSTQINSWRFGLEIPVVLMFDQRIAYAYLQKIASDIDRPQIEADLSLKGVQVIAINGQVGRLLNVDKTMALLTAQLQAFIEGEVPLIIDVNNPTVIEVNTLAETLRNVLGSPLVLSLPNPQVNDPGPWIIDPVDIAEKIKIQRIIIGEITQFSISFDESRLMPILEDIGVSIQGKSENARFIFNDETHQLELFKPAIIGKTINLEETLAIIQHKVFQGEHTIEIVVNQDLPLVGDDAQAQTLRITELVYAESTFFRGSSPERIQNIKTAAGQFKGLLVAPGETFSMGAVLGDISLENGYAEALIIYDDRTIKGVGGGVCQVSTTLFRTAFFAGYPIPERHPHAYRVGYYEQVASGAHDNRLAGLDATVYVPLVDFKFTNDTQYWLLMETYIYNNNQLEWKFYSTNDGRDVSWTTTGLQNIIPAPEPLLQENAELDIYEMKQVDYSADGAYVRVDRTVVKNDQFYFSDSFATSYSPWQAICEFGSGVEDPKTRAAEKGICQP